MDEEHLRSESLAISRKRVSRHDNHLKPSKNEGLDEFHPKLYFVDVRDLSLNSSNRKLCCIISGNIDEPGAVKALGYTANNETSQFNEYLAVLFETGIWCILHALSQTTQEYWERRARVEK